VLLQEIGPRADHALLEIAVLLEDFTGKDHRHRLREIVGEQHVRRLEMDTQRVLVRRVDRLDLTEGERLHPFLGVGLVAVP
jgi:hypothetical protein